MKALRKKELFFLRYAVLREKINKEDRIRKASTEMLAFLDIF